MGVAADPSAPLAPWSRDELKAHALVSIRDLPTNARRRRKASGEHISQEQTIKVALDYIDGDLSYAQLAQKHGIGTTAIARIGRICREAQA